MTLEEINSTHILIFNFNAEFNIKLTFKCNGWIALKDKDKSFRSRKKIELPKWLEFVETATWITKEMVVIVLPVTNEAVIGRKYIECV